MALFAEGVRDVGRAGRVGEDALCYSVCWRLVESELSFGVSKFDRNKQKASREFAEGNDSNRGKNWNG